MPENGSCTSRRSFLSSVAGSLLATFLPKRQLLIGDNMATSSSAYRGQSVAKTHLKWDVFVTPSIPVVTTDFAPGEHERPWPPISSTLIYGSPDAVLLDSFITLEQGRAQAASVASPGHKLTTIYATHLLGDHFFGSTIILARVHSAG